MEAKLKKRLDEIAAVIDVEKFISIHPDKQYIQKYYSINKFPYSIFHSSSGLIHLGLTQGKHYRKEDLLGMTRIVSNYIADVKAQDVLELATGRGGNSLYLAKQFPRARFYGIDISQDQLSFASKGSQTVKNYTPSQSDYHVLSQFEDDSIDLVFVIEALCYSNDKETVLKEVLRVLKGDGLFLVFDGYARKKKVERTSNEQLACSLVEKGMALPPLEQYSDFLDKARRHFSVVEEDDLSSFVIPTMQRFEKMARIFFSIPPIAKLLTRIIPKEFIGNAAVGYLWPATMESGLYCYMSTVLRK